jgi:hypothetical protein
VDGCAQWEAKILMHAQCVQDLLGLCPINIQDASYFQNFTLLIHSSLPKNQYIAGIDLKVFENSHCTPFVGTFPFDLLDGVETISFHRQLEPNLANTGDCDSFSGQRIAYDLRFVGWGIIVEERPGTLFSKFGSNRRILSQKRLRTQR